MGQDASIRIGDGIIEIPGMDLRTRFESNGRSGIQLEDLVNARQAMSEYVAGLRRQGIDVSLPWRVSGIFRTPVLVTEVIDDGVAGPGLIANRVDSEDSSPLFSSILPLVELIDIPEVRGQISLMGSEDGRGTGPVLVTQPLCPFYPTEFGLRVYLGTDLGADIEPFTETIGQLHVVLDHRGIHFERDFDEVGRRQGFRPVVVAEETELFLRKGVLLAIDQGRLDADFLEFFGGATERR